MYRSLLTSMDQRALILMLIRAHFSGQLPPVGPIPLAGELSKLSFNANGLWYSINSVRQPARL